MSRLAECKVFICFLASVFGVSRRTRDLAVKREAPATQPIRKINLILAGWRSLRVRSEKSPSGLSLLGVEMLVLLY